MLWFLILLSMLIDIISLISIGLIVTINNFTVFKKIDPTKRNLINTYTLITTFSLFIYLFGMFNYITSSSSSPEKAIKKYAFLEGNILKNYELKIIKTNEFDNYRGNKFLVKGFEGRIRGDTSFFFLKETVSGWCVVIVENG